MDLLIGWSIAWILVGILGYLGTVLYLCLADDEPVTFVDILTNMWLVLLGPITLLLVMVAVFLSIPNWFKRKK